MTIDELIERLNDKAGFVESLRERELEGALYRQASATLTSLQERNRKLEEALTPFAEFAAAWDRKPLLGIGDGFYSIHGGTEFEATVRLSDCRRARALLSGAGE